MDGLSIKQDAEKVRQQRSHLGHILNVPQRGYACGVAIGCGLAGQPF
jgi:hypothetical protein